MYSKNSSFKSNLSFCYEDQLDRLLYDLSSFISSNRWKFQRSISLTDNQHAEYFIKLINNFASSRGLVLNIFFDPKRLVVSFTLWNNKHRPYT